MAAPRSTLRRGFRALGWVAVGVFVNEHVVTLKYPTFNPDSSMMYRDIVVVNRLAALDAAYGDRSWFKPGDVVALKSPIDPSNLLIKRLIALPQSLVRTLPSPHSTKPDGGSETVRVPQGHCWIEGDERYHTRDSNLLGPVPMGCLEGRVEYIVWPPSRFGPIPDRPVWEKRVVTPRENFFA
ncbi:hypothetical protein JCM8097_003360 [Rhodosporidiobolus ruineniae]